MAVRPMELAKSLEMHDRHTLPLSIRAKPDWPASVKGTLCL